MRICLFLSVAALGLVPTGANAQSHMTAIFTDADTNHDGKITRAEFIAARTARFDKMDRNGDGVISRDDFTRLIGFRPKAGPMIDAMIAEADANHDGKVTRAEMAVAPTSQFDRADTNHDNVVDQAELTAYAAQIRAQF